MPRGIPEDVAAINRAIRTFLDTKHENGQAIGSALGVYAFFDYDTEPIYAGQTEERLRARIGRHMTNQRTDAVAMSVLDPFEVAYIEVWPLRFGKPSVAEQETFRHTLGAAEYTAFQKVLRASKLGAVLNKKIFLQLSRLSYLNPTALELYPTISSTYANILILGSLGEQVL